ILAYLDNILIYLKRLLKEYKEYIKKLEKYHFHVIEVNFLRFIIFREGITIKPSKI
ncbi:hypothetical protein K469DRAFT_568810, partial [Zopfia rhizophila CBS 207.26]